MEKYAYQQPRFYPFIPYYPMMWRAGHEQMQKEEPKPKVQMPEEDMDGLDEMDMAYMLQLYPILCKKIYKYVKEMCDTMEHNGSAMYDELPDKETLIKIVEKVYDKMKEDHMLNAQEITMDRAMPRRYYGSIYRDLITVVLLGEIFGNRRRRYRRRRRPYQGGYYDDYYDGYYDGNYYNDYYPYY